jgi:6-pyruvoyl-tetrahydropterin synthase
MDVLKEFTFEAAHRLPNVHSSHKPLDLAPPASLPAGTVSGHRARDLHGGLHLPWRGRLIMPAP